MDILDKLNPQQKSAVTAGLGPVLVLAGPGSGKTRVLTQRIAYLIQVMGVRPYRILAVTFTNKAAREMESRVERMLGEKPKGIWLGTFHAKCASLLRREADLLPVNNNFTILDADDQESIVKRILKDMNLDEKIYRPNGIHAAISQAKNNMVLPGDYAVAGYRDEVVKRVYQAYQITLERNNAMDFDDLLFMSVRLLDEHPEVREVYARLFEYILVDEFQDTNLAQYQLLRHLASYHGNVFVVGDEDQSIYRWRGADYRNVLNFEHDFQNVQKILLEQNYRSTQTVLDAAVAVINRNEHRTPKKLFSDRGAGDKITLFTAVDEHTEAEYVASSIQQLVYNRQAGLGDFAVMYRTNAQSRVLEETFLRAGLPYRLVGALRFYGRREIKDILSFLRLAQNSSDEISLRRVINVPARGIGDKTLETLFSIALQAKTAPGEVLMDLGKNLDKSAYWNLFTTRAVVPLANFGELLSRWQIARDDQDLPALFDQILSDTNYRDYIDDNTEEGRDRWENVEELRRLVYEYQDRGLTAFLENMALVSDQDTLPEHAEAPTMLTLHAAKGLEFPRVFIVGLDEGTLPHSRSIKGSDPEEMAEERRLFYVGITRAENNLTLVRSLRRSTYGQTEPTTACRFLKDIPKNLLKLDGMTDFEVEDDDDEDEYQPRQRYGRWESSQNTWSQPRKENQPKRREQSYVPPESWQTTSRPVTRPRTEPEPPPVPVVVRPIYELGMRVRNTVWGEGMVVNDTVQNGEEMVEVMFESVGLKRLLAGVAKLEIL